MFEILDSENFFQRLNKRELEACELLERVVGNHLIRYFQILGFDLDQAQDLKSVTLLNLFGGSLRTYSPEKGRLSSYVFILAKNEALQKKRRDRYSKEIQLEVALGADASNREWELVEAAPDEMLQAFEVAMRSLTQDERCMIRWRFQDGETSAVIAKRLGIPSNAVRKRQSRILLKLRKELERIGFREVRGKTERTRRGVDD